MGKKKDKLLAAQQKQSQQQVPWAQVDDNPVGFLVAPEDPATFFSKYWEKQPAVFKATPGRAALFQGLCSLPAVLNWLKQRERKAGPLDFGCDVIAARFRDGARETLAGEVADTATLQELHNQDGCTLQLVQPQRFFDPCWRLLAALERQLGCLVGSNAYLTPSGTQGLAPHHDDVELWVVQTGGSKRWRLYQPINGFQLPNAPSGDLDPASLGPPVMEVELNVGDCLYMPRGTVHQAEAVSNDSSHITISTFQRCSFADLATHLLQVGLSVQEEEARCLPLEARFSPKPGTLLQHSLHHVLAVDNPATSTTPDAVRGLAGALRAIAEKLEGSQGAGMLTAAVHSTSIDYLMNRLPPHPKQLAPKGPAPTLDDKVWCRVAGWGYLLPFEMTGMVCEEEEEGSNAGLEEGCMKLCSCLTNSREEHMIVMPDDDLAEEEEEDDDEDDEDDDDEEDEEEQQGGVKVKVEGDVKVKVEDGADSGSDAERARAKARRQAKARGKGRGKAASASEEEEDGDAPQGSAGSDEAAAAAAAAANGHEGVSSHEAKKGAAKAAGDGSEQGEHDGHCCDDACGHGHGGGGGHSLSSGADRANPVAAMPGLVFEPKAAQALIEFLAADAPEKAIAVRDLKGLSSDASKLQWAFALWAEDLAATVQGGAKGEGGAKKEGGKQQQGKTAKRPAEGGEQVATSMGKERAGKKAKA